MTNWPASPRKHALVGSCFRCFPYKKPTQSQAPAARGTNGSPIQSTLLRQTHGGTHHTQKHVVPREEMGSCISRSPASSSAKAAGSSERRAATAKVVGLDGSMTQYVAPVTAREALGNAERNRNESVFLCSSDELRFDAPPRALADEEELQPGWLYFVLPVSMLRLALSEHEMAALAVRASSALAIVSGVASPPRRKNMPGTKGKQRKTARVAPLVAPGQDTELADKEWSQQAYGKYGGTRKKVRGGGAERAGKPRKRSSYRSRGARHRRRAADGVQRLSVILEDDDF